MEKQIGKIERKSRSQVGSFLFGTFIGLLLGIGAIFGIGAFAYFKVSANWINDKFNANISLGNDDLNSLTLNKLVNHSISLAKNIDSYTLNNLDEDFGIKVSNKIIGIDITDLKDVPFPELLDAIQNKLSNISAEELKEVFTFEGDLNDILNKTNTYYFNSTNKKLYKEETFNNEVTFAYTYNETDGIIDIKGHKSNIATGTGEVEIALKYLPLTVVLSDFTNKLGDNITLEDIKNYLPSFLNKPEYLSKTVSELADIIDNLYVAEILGYAYNGSGDVMNGGSVVTGVVGAIAKFKIATIGTDIANLTVGDIFGTQTTGILSLISANTKIDNIADSLSTALENKTIDDFITAEVVNKPSTYDDNKGKVITSKGKTLAELTLSDLVDVLFDDTIIAILTTTP